MDSLQASVLVVEKHPLMREAICVAIQDNPFLYVATQAASSDEVADILNHHPNVILFSAEHLSYQDVSMLRHLRLILPNIPIVVLTNQGASDPEQSITEIGNVITLSRSASCNEFIQVLIDISGIHTVRNAKSLENPISCCRSINNDSSNLF